MPEIGRFCCMVRYSPDNKKHRENIPVLMSICRAYQQCRIGPLIVPSRYINHPNTLNGLSTHLHASHHLPVSLQSMHRVVSAIQCRATRRDTRRTPVESINRIYGDCRTSSIACISGFSRIRISAVSLSRIVLFLHKVKRTPEIKKNARRDIHGAHQKHNRQCNNYHLIVSPQI